MFKRGLKSRYARFMLKSKAWRAPFKLFKWRKSKSNKNYNLVSDDENDLEIPLHPDEAFEYGITFGAKYIGTLDVPKPANRIEIVAAMRRARHDFKADGVDQRKVLMDISTNGVRVTLRTKNNGFRRFFRRKRKNAPPKEPLELLNHPIYRIFYVSHDSYDVKVFSYIAREGSSNEFTCNVFKSKRNKQAMRIVRTVGQAFDVCHKMKITSPGQQAASTDGPSTSGMAGKTSKATPSTSGASVSGGASTSKGDKGEAPQGSKGKQLARPTHLDLPPSAKKGGGKRSQLAPPILTVNLPELPEFITKIDLPVVPEIDSGTPLMSAQHQLKLLRERLEQQAHQTQAAVAQLILMRDQLAAEQTARCEAQSRTHQLLIHNNELIEHISTLVTHLNEREKENAQTISAQQLTMLPQKNVAVKHVGHAETNGNREQAEDDALINFNSPQATKSKQKQNVENNNVPRTPYSLSPSEDYKDLNLADMTSEEIQDYLIKKFQSIKFLNDQSDNNDYQPFYQNRRAFPDIPLLDSEFTDTELVNEISTQLAQDGSCSAEDASALGLALGLGKLELSSGSSSSSSKGSSSECSSDEGHPYIMPLSHSIALKARGKDGRMQLIVPVSPSESASDKSQRQGAAPGGASSLPGSSTSSPITRTTSERVSNKSEFMAALREKWTRHTTK